MKKLLALCAIATLSGCVAVPYTTISGDLNKGTFAVRSPKNGTLEGLDITRGTNGTVHIVVLKHTVLMDPNVIQQTAEGQAKLIDAAGKIAGDAFDKGVQAAGKTIVP